jgi:hypothetical protein
MMRVGAACAIAGPVLALVVNAVHPRPSRDAVGEHAEFLRLASESGIWTVVHLGLIVAFVLFLAGLAALTSSLEYEHGYQLARVGLFSAAVAGAVGIVQATLDTALGEVAEDWAAASGSEKDAVLRAGGALEDLDFMLLSVELVLFFGVTFVVYGLAMTRSRRYPARLGWVAVGGGVAGVVLGFTQALQGEASVLTLFALPAVAAVLSLWLLVAGVLLWRQVGAEATPGS